MATRAPMSFVGVELAHLIRHGSFDDFLQAVDSAPSSSTPHLDRTSPLTTSDASLCLLLSVPILATQGSTARTPEFCFAAWCVLIRRGADPFARGNDGRSIDMELRGVQDEGLRQCFERELQYARECWAEQRAYEIPEDIQQWIYDECETARSHRKVEAGQAEQRKRRRLEELDDAITTARRKLERPAAKRTKIVEPLLDYEDVVETSSSEGLREVDATPEASGSSIVARRAEDQGTAASSSQSRTAPSMPATSPPVPTSSTLPAPMEPPARQASTSMKTTQKTSSPQLALATSPRSAVVPVFQIPSPARSDPAASPSSPSSLISTLRSSTTLPTAPSLIPIQHSPTMATIPTGPRAATFAGARSPHLPTGAASPTVRSPTLLAGQRSPPHTSGARSPLLSTAPAPTGPRASTSPPKSRPLPLKSSPLRPSVPLPPVSSGSLPEATEPPSTLSHRTGPSEPPSISKTTLPQGPSVVHRPSAAAPGSSSTTVPSTIPPVTVASPVLPSSQRPAGAPTAEAAVADTPAVQAKSSAPTDVAASTSSVPSSSVLPAPGRRSRLPSSVQSRLPASIRIASVAPTATTIPSSPCVPSVPPCAEPAGAAPPPSTQLPAPSSTQPLAPPPNQPPSPATPSTGVTGTQSTQTLSIPTAASPRRALAPPSRDSSRTSTPSFQAASTMRPPEARLRKLLQRDRLSYPRSPPFIRSSL
ncbi:hypothetical protein JCM10212_005086 [Sporobolomyces blumeae]